MYFSHRIIFAEERVYRLTKHGFKTNHECNEIIDILNRHTNDADFFVFPLIGKKAWRDSLADLEAKRGKTVVFAHFPEQLFRKSIEAEPRWLIDNDKFLIGTNDHGELVKVCKQTVRTKSYPNTFNLLTVMKGES